MKNSQNFLWSPMLFCFTVWKVLLLVCLQRVFPRLMMVGKDNQNEVMKHQHATEMKYTLIDWHTNFETTIDLCCHSSLCNFICESFAKMSQFKPQQSWSMKPDLYEINNMKFNLVCTKFPFWGTILRNLFFYLYPKFHYCHMNFNHLIQMYAIVGSVQVATVKLAMDDFWVAWVVFGIQNVSAVIVVMYRYLIMRYDTCKNSSGYPGFLRKNFERFSIFSSENRI